MPDGWFFHAVIHRCATLRLQTQIHADLNQSLDSTCYELAVWAKVCCRNWSPEAKVVQLHLSFPVYQESFALDVNSQQQQSIRTKAKSSELP